MNCEHLNFGSRVKIGRLHSENNPKVITRYTADIEISCTDCGIPFQFIGLPHGASINEPCCSIGAEEARLPIEPRRYVLTGEALN